MKSNTNGAGKGSDRRPTNEKSYRGGHDRIWGGLTHLNSFNESGRAFKLTCRDETAVSLETSFAGVVVNLFFKDGTTKQNAIWTINAGALSDLEDITEGFVAQRK